MRTILQNSHHLKNLCWIREINILTTASYNMAKTSERSKQIPTDIHPQGTTLLSTTRKEETGCVVTETLIILLCVFLICVFIFSFGGILLVLVSVCRKKILRKKASLFVLNLMICDFFTALLSIPAEVVYVIGNEEWLMGQAGYYFTMGNSVCFITMSFLNITAVTLERFVAITYPFMYQRCITRGKITIVIVLIWLYSILLSVLLSSTLDPNEYNFMIPEQYYYPFLIIQVLLPIAIVTLAYLKLLSIARHHARRINVVIGGNGIPSNRSGFRQNLKAAKTVGMFFMTLLFVWLPFCVVQFMQSSSMSYCSWILADTISICVTYTTGALNLFIYWWNDVEFRRYVKKITNCAGENLSEDLQSTTGNPGRHCWITAPTV